MKDDLIARAKKGINVEMRLHLLREELHHLILQEADRKGAFGKICFVGGTALRILFGLDRFSEDLDFSVSKTAGVFDLTSLAQGLRQSLEAFGIPCEIRRPKTVGAVHGCFFTFTGLLHETDPSFPKNQNLSIKFEVDTNPPQGGIEQTSPVTGARVYKIRHYNLPSLFAGKLNAVLYRVYTKGRDLYDFLWYVGRNTPVNYTLLQNGIEQTTKTKITLTREGLQKMLREKFEKTDFEQAKRDIAPFLLDPRALSLFEKETFLNAVQKVG